MSIKEYDYIPVEVTQDNEKTYWYIDISNLGLSSLIKLKNELKGIQNTMSIRKLDIIIHEQYGLDYHNENMHHKEYKKQQKALFQEKKFKSKKRHR